VGTGHLFLNRLFGYLLHIHTLNFWEWGYPRCSWRSLVSWQPSLWCSGWLCMSVWRCLITIHGSHSSDISASHPLSSCLRPPCRSLWVLADWYDYSLYPDFLVPIVFRNFNDTNAVTFDLTTFLWGHFNYLIPCSLALLFDRIWSLGQRVWSTCPSFCHYLCSWWVYLSSYMGCFCMISSYMYGSSFLFLVWL
jgi:hypothetical protein